MKPNLLPNRDANLSTQRWSMKTIALVTIMMLLATSLAFPQVAITIYNQNLAVVKDTRDMDFPNGVGDIQFRDVASQIDPTSVHFKAQNVELLEQNYQYDLVSPSKILDKYVDHDIQVITDSKQGSDVYSGTLLAFTSGNDGDIVLKSKTGEIMIVRRSTIRDITFPELPEGLITRPTLVWKVNSQKAGTRPAEVSYMTNGVSWHAEYVAVLAEAETSFDLSAWVSIDNKSGATYKDAKVKLMAGEVNILTGGFSREYGRAKADMLATGAPAFEEKAFADYHLYTLQRPSTLKDQEVKQISLFEPATVASNIVYTYDAARNAKRVKKELTFKNSQANGLGVPLPAGKFRVYQQDTDKSLEFIGEDQINHTPIDEEVKITVGYAFDLVGERERTDYKRIADKVYREAYRIKLRNHKKDKDVTIRVEEHLPGDWEILDKSQDYEKIDASTIRFTLNVPSGQEVVVTYLVQYTTR
jgi:hypothetical protein